MNWANKLADEFKNRNNPSVLGAILGIVVSPPPNLKISILEGQVYITKVYVLDAVLEEHERAISMPFENLEGELTIQPYKTKREDKEVLESKDYKINILEIKKKRITTKDTLKKGDEVLLISSQDNQIYFCIGRVTRLGGEE